MNSDAKPITTLVWTFGLMSLFAIGGANSAIPEMHRVAAMSHWMTDKQFADIFATFPISPDRTLLATLSAIRRGLRALVATVVRAADRGACLLCRRLPALAPFALARHYSGSAVPVSIGLMGASGLILALTSDRSWVAGLITVAAAVLAFATRLNPLWMLLAGGALGFAGLI
jgi:chromate transporter